MTDNDQIMIPSHGKSIDKPTVWMTMLSKRKSIVNLFFNVFSPFLFY